MSSIEEVKHLQIPLQDISSVTNGFAEENLIAKGGFGKVYKGLSEKHGYVAIKRLDHGQWQGDHEFKTEIMLLSKYKHENIVSLYGFCDEQGEKILVYKHESNGSLDKHLNNPDLTWIQRIRICLDAAQGLKYLHDDVEPQQRILHRDVKSTNILLDDNWKAKISDFGLSRIGPANIQSTFLISNFCGTVGYTDPEYLIHGYLTQKSDVYSFGVVLFEVLCGRPTQVTSFKDERQYLVIWAKKHYKRHTLDKIIHPDLQKTIDTTSLVTFSNIAYQCLRNGDERPTMKTVLEQLWKALENQLASSGLWAKDKTYSNMGIEQSSSMALFSHIDLGSSSQSWNHDVFISYGPEGTHMTFTDHLFTALEQRQILTYKDGKALVPGEYIGPSLLKVIEESRIAVIIFTENYAKSSCCLDELAYIMKCREKRGQIVIPIFYDIGPSEVRKQKRKYGETFAKHMTDKNNKVESWRKALVDASFISGWEPKHFADGHEAKCIKEIVSTISHKLHPVISSADENMIGIEARMQDLLQKLEIGSGGVLTIGIWGVVGGGKTTLASSLYDYICNSFDGCCFVENVRKESSSKKGLEKLKKRIISDVLKENQVKVSRVEKGRLMMNSRLCYKKVLIILDDVDHLDQIEALARPLDWFGEGSRIIITTRHNHVLNGQSQTVNVIHKVSLLNDDEGIKLFHKYAYRHYRPVEGYEFLAKDVVSYANGLPLALKVLGSFLCDKSLNEWMSALAQLKEIPRNNILLKLKISFDGLQPDEKQLFLDIACFFKGEKLNNAKEILDVCGFYPDIGVKVLIQKALISVLHRRFDMHDLVQQMGHFMVRGEHPKNPEKHSRIWQVEDVRKICDMEATTELDKVEAIRVISNDDHPLPCHHPQIIAKMKKLRWIEWVGLSESSLPENFPSEELCCLILSHCDLVQLWDGYKYLPNLRLIKLEDMEMLNETPDFDGLPNLERFALIRCRTLEKIHSSIGRLERLAYLTIRDCDNLKRFPPITRSQKLKTFKVSNCTKLLYDSEIQQNMDSLKEGEPSLPQNINIVNNQRGLHFFGIALSKLILNDCNLGDEDIDSVVWELSNLQELYIGSNRFSRLNFDLWKIPRLKRLDVSWCNNLVELSGIPPSIASLGAEFCASLESIGDISNCKCLWRVSFFGNHKLGGLGGTKILDSMLQGNAFEDHFVSLIFSGHQIPKGLVNRLVGGNTFTLQLPQNWYNDFSGFLMYCFNSEDPYVSILIKYIDKDCQTDVSEESSEEPTPYFVDFNPTTYVGYVSFNSIMRHMTSWLNSEYNTISFSISNKYGASYEVTSRFVAELVPRKSKGDPLQTSKVATDCSDNYYHEHGYRKMFTFQRHSNSSIKILWDPLCN